MEEVDSLASNSIAVAASTIVSRVTGLGRVALTAAVLGPTFLGNTFQVTNLVPMLTFEVLTGSMLVSLLVPPLVRAVDRGRRQDVEQLAGSVLGLVLAGMAAIAILVVVAGPLLLRLLTAGVDDPATAVAQRRVGWLLLVLVMPQVVLYGVAGVGAAVMNAHGRFALAAGAPALENVGLMATLATWAVVFGSDVALEEVGGQHIALLGLGSTAAVGLHTGAQLWGARRVGVRLVPRAGWRAPDVRDIIRRVLPTVGYAGLGSALHFLVLVVTNSVAGGVVAFQLAFNLFYFPIAVAARPVAVALLPELSRLSARGALVRFRKELVAGASLAAFLVVPAAFAYLVLAEPLSSAVSFGEMAGPEGVALLAVSLAALAPGVLGEASFVLATQAAYAANDARSPFQARVARTVVGSVGMILAPLVASGATLLVLVGLAFSAGTLFGAAFLWWRVLSPLPPAGPGLWPAMLRHFASSALMVGPAYLAASGITGSAAGWSGDVAAAFVAVVVGLVVFLAVQRTWGSPELERVLQGLAHRVRRTA